jgi:hypothetical protein
MDAYWPGVGTAELLPWKSKKALPHTRLRVHLCLA